MSIRAVKFLARSAHETPLQSLLTIDTPQDVEKTKTEDVLAAYVVRVQDAAVLRALRGVIVDRGKKHERKALSGRLLGHSQIPLIHGEYKDPGQLRRSVRALLINAARRDERNLYLVSVDEGIFDAVWKAARDPKAPTATRTASRSRKASSRRVRYGGDTDVPAHELLQSIGEEEEPRELRERYVGESDEVRLVRQLILRAARSHPTIEDELAALDGQMGGGRERTILVTHCPPAYTRCDVRYNGRHAGSKAIRRWIERWQPLLSLHGHIHESPEMSGSFADRIGKTMTVNPGSDKETPYLVMIELENLDGMTHSVFGTLRT